MHPVTAFRGAYLGRQIAGAEKELPRLMQGAQKLRAGAATAGPGGAAVKAQRAGGIERRHAEMSQDLSARKAELDRMKNIPYAGGVTPPATRTGGTAPVTTGAESAGEAARAGEKATKTEVATAAGGDAKPQGKPAGMMDSINKALKGEKLSPEERAHVIKAGLGAFAADRYILHGGRD
jgi:hypothetical protein